MPDARRFNDAGRFEVVLHRGDTEAWLEFETDQRQHLREGFPRFLATSQLPRLPDPDEKLDHIAAWHDTSRAARQFLQIEVAVKPAEENQPVAGLARDGRELRAGWRRLDLDVKHSGHLSRDSRQ